MKKRNRWLWILIAWAIVAADAVAYFFWTTEALLGLGVAVGCAVVITYFELCHPV